MPVTFLDNVVGLGWSFGFGQNAFCGGCPIERSGIAVAHFHVLGDGGLQFGDTAEDATMEPILNQFAKPALHQVEPRRGCGNEVKTEPRMANTPSLNLGVLMGPLCVRRAYELERSKE